MKTVVILLFALVSVFGFSSLRQVPAVHRGGPGRPGHDTLLVQTKAAVYYYPTAKRADIRKKKIGEKSFKIAADDFVSGFKEIAKSLEKDSVPSIEARNKNFLIFVQHDGSRTVVNLDSLREIWGVYLFTPEKQPKPLDMMDFTMDIKNYYQ